MEGFKKFMAIPMSLTALWLLWVLSNQVSEIDLLKVVLGISIILILIGLNNFNNLISSNSKINIPLIFLSLIGILYLIPMKDIELTSKEEIFSVSELNKKISEGPVLLNYGIDECRFTKPVYAGSTIGVKFTVKEKIDQETKPEDKISKGIVKFLVDVYDEKGETVAIATILTMIKKLNQKI